MREEEDLIQAFLSPKIIPGLVRLRGSAVCCTRNSIPSGPSCPHTLYPRTYHPTSLTFTLRSQDPVTVPEEDPLSRAPGSRRPRGAFLFLFLVILIIITGARRIAATNVGRCTRRGDEVTPVVVLGSVWMREVVRRVRVPRRDAMRRTEGEVAGVVAGGGEEYLRAGKAMVLPATPAGEDNDHGVYDFRARDYEPFGLSPALPTPRNTQTVRPRAMPRIRYAYVDLVCGWTSRAAGGEVPAGLGASQLQCSWAHPWAWAERRFLEVQDQAHPGRGRQNVSVEAVSLPDARARD
ncbi:hypothetical protein C8R47DRAFT_1328550 [Mycena vitilis]|nr:hypothetical protein C8R47DRAFT_1328550 [Mycena vitilis]